MKTIKRKKKVKKRKKLNKKTEFQRQQEIKYAKTIELEEKIKNLIEFLKTNINLNYDDLGKIKEIVAGIKDYIDLSKVEQTIKEIFSIFDSNKTEELELRFLKDCMYALGLCFSEQEFKKFQIMLTPTTTQPNKQVLKKVSSRMLVGVIEKKVKFDDFLDLMIALIISDLYRLKSDKTLKSAFECLAFDIDNNNLIEWIDLENTLILSGEKFNEEEIEALKSFLSVDQTKNTFSYLNYIMLLSNDQNKLKNIKVNISEKYVEQNEIIQRFFC